VVLHAPEEDLRQPKNTALKVVGTPLAIQMSKTPLNTDFSFQVSLPPNNNVEAGSHRLYVLNKNNEWEIIESEIIGDKLVGKLDDVSRYTNNNHLTIATIAKNCVNCISSSHITPSSTENCADVLADGSALTSYNSSGGLEYAIQLFCVSLSLPSASNLSIS